MISKKDIILSYLICLFPILCLSIGKGHNYGPALLLLWSIWMLKETRSALSIPQVKIICIVFGAYFLSFLAALIIHGEKASYIDQTSRLIMAIPILLAVVTYRPNIKWIMYSFLIGAFIAGCIALYQTQIQDLTRAFERFGSGPKWWNKGYMPIQSGNIAMSLGIISLCFAIYFNKVGEKKTAFIALLAASFGILASFLSGSRGGWVFLPFALLYLLIANFKHSKKAITIVIMLFSIAIISATTNSQIQQQLRIDQAINDLEHYQYGDNKNSSLGIRFEFIKSALIHIPDHLFIGVSTQQRTELRAQHNAEKLVNIPENAMSWHSHNQYLEALSLRGIIGLTALVALLVLPIIIFSVNNISTNPQLIAINQAGITSTIMIWGYSLSQVFIGHNSGSIFVSVTGVLLMGLSISLAKQQTEIDKALPEGPQNKETP